MGRLNEKEVREGRNAGLLNLCFGLGFNGLLNRSQVSFKHQL